MLFIIISALTVSLFAFVLRSSYEKSHFCISSYNVLSEKIKDGTEHFKIVFLSDLHNNVFGSEQGQLVKAIKDETPNLILAGGDMITVKPREKKDFSVFYDIMSKLREITTVLYANGNHEQRMKNNEDVYPGWYAEFIRILKELDIEYLSDDCYTCPALNINVYGIDLEEYCYKKKFFAGHLPDGYVFNHLGKPDDRFFNIVLCHSPVYLHDLSDWGADLVLSGHFHGGTIRLPFIGGVVTPQYNFFYRRDKGMFSCNDTHMIVSGGLGTHSVNIRFNNMSEYVVCDIKKT